MSWHSVCGIAWRAPLHSCKVVCGHDPLMRCILKGLRSWLSHGFPCFHGLAIYSLKEECDDLMAFGCLNGLFVLGQVCVLQWYIP